MGVLSIMGQIETKIFHKVPAKYMKFAESNTQLDEEVVQICWNLRRSDSRSEDGKLDLAEFTALVSSLAKRIENEDCDSNKLFCLLDRDDDKIIEFDDVLVFLYSTDLELSEEDKRIRSFRFYDRLENRVITKSEMLKTLVVLGHIEMDLEKLSKKKKDKVKLPDEIENLFSLMDFAHDDKISEEELMRATGHYRRLGQLLTIDTWQQIRAEIINIIIEMKSLKDEESEENSSNKNEEPSQNEAEAELLKSEKKEQDENDDDNDAAHERSEKNRRASADATTKPIKKAENRTLLKLKKWMSFNKD